MKANSTFHGLTLTQLYYDRIHPSDSGHTILAQALIHLVKRSRLLYHATVEAGGELLELRARLACEAPTRALPPPMQEGVDARERQGLRCYGADSISDLIDAPRCTGWHLALEHSSSGAPKPGWVATDAGSACSFAYDIPVDSNATAHSIGVGYLKSYAHMGRVAFTCELQCQCKPTILEAHHELKISPLDLAYVSARITAPPPSSFSSVPSASRRCGFQLRVLNETSSGEHKFKLTALFLNQHGDGAFFGKWILNMALESASKAAHAAGTSE